MAETIWWLDETTEGKTWSPLLTNAVALLPRGNLTPSSSNLPSACDWSQPRQDSACGDCKTQSTIRIWLKRWMIRCRKNINQQLSVEFSGYVTWMYSFSKMPRPWKFEPPLRKSAPYDSAQHSIVILHWCLFGQRNDTVEHTGVRGSEATIQQLRKKIWTNTTKTARYYKEQWCWASKISYKYDQILLKTYTNR